MTIVTGDSHSDEQAELKWPHCFNRGDRAMATAATVPTYLVVVDSFEGFDAGEVLDREKIIRRLKRQGYAGRLICANMVDVGVATGILKPVGDLTIADFPGL
jgi:hypothetical protein